MVDYNEGSGSPTDVARHNDPHGNHGGGGGKRKRNGNNDGEGIVWAIIVLGTLIVIRAIHGFLTSL